MTVRELLERCDAWELAEWQAYDRLEPLGDLRDELRHGRLCALLVNLWTTDKHKDADPRRFMLDFDERYIKQREEKDRIEQQKARFRAFAMAFGTVVPAGGRNGN